MKPETVIEVLDTFNYDDRFKIIVDSINKTYDYVKNKDDGQYFLIDEVLVINYDFEYTDFIDTNRIIAILDGDSE